jgi:hypothetical protein
VRALGGDDTELLADIARSDDDPQVRRIALDKLTDPDLLAQLADRESDPAVRAHARGRAVDRFLSAALAGQGDLDGAILWLAGLEEQRPLAQLACRAPSAQHRRRALEKMTDARALADVVREAREEDVALSAIWTRAIAAPPWSTGSKTKRCSRRWRRAPRTRASARAPTSDCRPGGAQPVTREPPPANRRPW